MIEKMDTSAEKYVVLDVETNGLSSVYDDLLSISLYKPDDRKTFDRFLPLEMAKKVYTTDINGIKKEDLKGKKPLSQAEVDELFEDFELSSRTILHYGAIDEKFIKAYFKRHNLHGYEYMRFFNFKKLICSSPFSRGNITKDNLCDMFGIEGVTGVHSGINDCLLEWNLFEKIGGRHLLATSTDYGRTAIFALNPDYIIPVSYLQYPNLDKLVERPEIICQSEEIYRFQLKDKRIKRFPTNFSGMTIEHLINTMLGAEVVDSFAFQVENKRKLEYLGSIDSYITPILMSFNNDGTVTAAKQEDKKIEKELNDVILRLKKRIEPLIAFIRDVIFHGAKIFSQEISINKDINVMAVCDLSSQDAVLEIKTGPADTDTYKEQLYYEAAGRDCYIMGMDWDRYKAEVEFYILRVAFSTSVRRPSAKKRWEDRLAAKGIELTRYKGYDIPLGLKCNKCGHEWTANARQTQNKSFGCPACNQKKTNYLSKPSVPKDRVAGKDLKKERAEAYSLRVSTISEGRISICDGSYTGSKDKVIAHCNECGNEWTTRADHLLSRCWCPVCRKKK